MTNRPSLLALPVALLLLTRPAGNAAAQTVVAEEGQDFADEVVLLHRVVACAEGTEVEVPTGWTEVVDDHCTKLGRQTTRFRGRYIDKAIPFLASMRPEDLPRTVVYPFGGGDLASALVTYPDADEVTTISLEHAGDPTRLADLTASQLKLALADFRGAIAGLLASHDSATVKLQSVQRGPLPGQVSFFLTALSVFGYQPVSLRYFRIEPDGSLHYYTAEEIANLAPKRARKIRTWGVNTDHSIAFSNAELVFERSGGDRVVHRHIAANLDNSHFKGSPLDAHLTRKGPIVALTKAASYLLWSNGFSAVRDYLLSNAVYMVSDSTGIPPHHARRAGLEQRTYGRFTGPYLRASAVHTIAFADLWLRQPYRRLRFRYGYPDAAGNFHLLVTQRPK